MKKSVLFAVRNMNIGGVEKSLISLLNALDPSEYDVDLLLLENNGGFLESIPPWVRVIAWDDYSNIRDEVNLPPVSVIKNLFSQKRIGRAIRLSIGFLKYKISKNIIYYYKSVFRGLSITGLKEHYDTAVSYTSLISYLSYTVLNYVNADRYIGWIHFDVSKLVLEKKSIRKLHENMSKIYVVSQEAYRSFVSFFPELADKCEIKYNIIDEKEIKRLSNEYVESIKENGKLIIITLGRLTSEKGQDIVPEIALELKREHLSFKWFLIGDGSLRDEIENKKLQYGLQSEIVLLGTKKNPYPYLKQADIYVQTSIHEGYCITLAEAKLFCLNIISTEFAGAYEQLDDYANGIVVPREKNKIKEAILQMARDDHLCLN